MKYRIVSNGKYYVVQCKSWGDTLGLWMDDDSISGARGGCYAKTLEEAKRLKREQEESDAPYRVVES